MQNDTSELERNRLNKKLLKSTFSSELKTKKKGERPIKLFIDILTIFVALLLADKIKALFSVSFWLADMLIYLAVIAVLTIIGKLIDSCINKIIFKK